MQSRHGKRPHGFRILLPCFISGFPCGGERMAQIGHFVPDIKKLVGHKVADLQKSSCVKWYFSRHKALIVQKFLIKSAL
ncbi:MAG: hypothetical protein Q4A06_00210 [Cardiobacteriaceae bacterium]|nr:hypothetical protein [Cardiobacteriaceae bacterium]